MGRQWAPTSLTHMNCDHLYTWMASSGGQHGDTFRVDGGGHGDTFRFWGWDKKNWGREFRGLWDFRGGAWGVMSLGSLGCTLWGWDKGTITGLGMGV